MTKSVKASSGLGLAKAVVLVAVFLFAAGGTYLGYLAWTSWQALDNVLGPSTPSGSGQPQAAVGDDWESRGRVNLLLMGLDRRPADGRIPARTDTMIILSIDPYEKSASMLSIPRDL